MYRLAKRVMCFRQRSLLLFFRFWSFGLVLLVLEHKVLHRAEPVGEVALGKGRIGRFKTISCCSRLTSLTWPVDWQLVNGLHRLRHWSRRRGRVSLARRRRRLWWRARGIGRFAPGRGVALGFRVWRRTQWRGFSLEIAKNPIVESLGTVVWGWV